MNEDKKGGDEDKVSQDQEGRKSFKNPAPENLST